MATKEDKQAMWVGWTHDAMSRFEMPLEVGGEEEFDDLIDDMAAVSTAFADAMLEEYENRFEAGPKRKRKKKSKRADPDDDDDDDDDPD